MALLGGPIEQVEKPAGAVRYNKDLGKEALFGRRLDLLTEVELVFLDSTSPPRRIDLAEKAAVEKQRANAATAKITDPIWSKWM